MQRRECNELSIQGVEQLIKGISFLHQCIVEPHFPELGQGICKSRVFHRSHDTSELDKEPAGVQCLHKTKYKQTMIH